MSVKKAWLTIKGMVRRLALSPWMSVIAALAVVLGTAGTYLSGEIASDVQACDVRRELLLVNGSPELRLGRAALLKISEARTYLVLAIGTTDLEKRREYAFLSITAANIAIVSTPAKSGAQTKLIPLPSDKELFSPQYIDGLTETINNLDIVSLVQTLKVHDENFEKEISEIYSCNRIADIGDVIGVVSVLLTLLSLALIGFREYHQGSARSGRRPGKSVRRTRSSKSPSS